MTKKEMRQACLIFAIVGVVICCVLNTRLHWGTFGISLGFAMLFTEAYGQTAEESSD